MQETFISKDALSIPKWPGWGSLVILWDCGSLDPSSNLGPGPSFYSTTLKSRRNIARCCLGSTSGSRVSMKRPRLITTSSSRV